MIRNLLMLAALGLMLLPLLMWDGLWDFILYRTNQEFA